MRYGPLSPFDIGCLKEILDANGVTYSVESSSQDVAVIDQTRRDNYRPRSKPQYEGPLAYLYIEVPDAAVPLIKDELEKMAIGIEDTGDELTELPTESTQAFEKNTEPKELRVRLIALGLLVAVVALIYFVVKAELGHP
jgi:hypothetical protein